MIYLGLLPDSSSQSEITVGKRFSASSDIFQCQLKEKWPQVGGIPLNIGAGSLLLVMQSISHFQKMV